MFLESKTLKISQSIIGKVLKNFHENSRELQAFSRSISKKQNFCNYSKYNQAEVKNSACYETLYSQIKSANQLDFGKFLDLENCPFKNFIECS